eukprot:3159816-Rhodomonas_salina.1
MNAFADMFWRDVALVECEGKRSREESENDESFAWEVQVGEENAYAQRKMRKQMRRLQDAGLGRRAARELAIS